jgi:hypothetical protein
MNAVHPDAATARSHDMKYMLLIYNNPAALSDDQMNEAMQAATSIMGELTESGEWIGGEGLADSSNAKTVRVRDGVPAITDGPFIEAKEQFAGYCLFDCETEERAIEIATRWPDAKYWAVELRAVMGQSGTEM